MIKRKSCSLFLAALLLSTLSVSSYVSAETFTEMKNSKERDGWHVIWSRSYGFGDAAALATCVYLGCAQNYLGNELRELASHMGPQLVEQALRNKGKIIFGPGNLQTEAGTAYYSNYANLFGERVTVDRHVRLYVRYRRGGNIPGEQRPVNQNDNWGNAARTSHRTCRQRGFNTGFPSGEEGIENNRRVIEAWCLNDARRVAIRSNANVHINWGEAARISHRECRRDGFDTGFPSGEEGIERGNRVIEAWCLNNIRRIPKVSAVNVHVDWGIAAREGHRLCRENQLPTGFSSGEEGIEQGQRVVEFWCPRTAQRIVIRSNDAVN